MLKIEHVVIIGSGPAGLTAALYAARMGLNPLVIRGPLPGGQLMTTSWVENWPGEQRITGPNLIQQIYNHAKHFQTRFIDSTVTNITTKKPFTLTLKNSSLIKTHSLIIASGAHPRRLNCPGEEIYWGRGVSSCAVCDGAFFKNKTVLVVGGGNSALEQVSFLSRFAKKIILVHRGTQLSATEMDLKKTIEKIPHLEIRFSTQVTQILGNKEQVTHAILTQSKNNTEEKTPIDGIFVAIGTIANTTYLPPSIKCSENQQIIIDQQNQTNIAGIFAAGDATINAYRQAITASSEGCAAALNVRKYLKKTGILLN